MTPGPAGCSNCRTVQERSMEHSFHHSSRCGRARLHTHTAELSKRLWCGRQPFRKHAILQVGNPSDFSKSGRSSEYRPRKRIVEEQFFEWTVSFDAPPVPRMTCRHAIFLFSQNFPCSIAVGEKTVDRKKVNKQTTKKAKNAMRRT